MRFLYNLLIRLFGLGVLLVSPFNMKARKWTIGRKDVLAKIKSDIKETDRVIWFHCASLGEFEQGRPVIEKVRSKFKSYKIILTFFSPSGYDIRRDYEGVDFVYYLHNDTSFNAKQFVKLVHPRIVFFVKYEFWFNYINELYKNKIPIIIVSAIFRRGQYFFKPWGGWGRRQLQKVTFFFVQNEKSLALLRLAKIYHAEISGDTRFDRVVKLTQEKISFPVIERFKNNKPIFIAGSTWPVDEDLLLEVLNKSKEDFKIIIAPHIVNKEHINQLINKFSDYQPVCFSDEKNDQITQSRVMIIDSIGKLSEIYQYGTLAYIGGGFGVGIHNTLEAATYGIPVIFGPNYQRFREAVELKELGCAFPVQNANDCSKVVNLMLTDKTSYAACASSAREYVIQNAGATDKVIEKAGEYLSIK